MNNRISAIALALLLAASTAGAQDLFDTFNEARRNQSLREEQERIERRQREQQEQIDRLRRIEAERQAERNRSRDYPLANPRCPGGRLFC